MLQYANALIEAGHSVSIVCANKGIECTINPKIKVITYSPFPIPFIDFLTFQRIYSKKVIRAIPDSDIVIPIYSPLLIPAIKAKQQKTSSTKIILLFQDCFEMFWVGPYIQRMLKNQAVIKHISGAIAVSKSVGQDFEDTTKIRIISNNKQGRKGKEKVNK
jgi:hypothetical protein